MAKITEKYEALYIINPQLTEEETQALMLMAGFVTQYTEGDEMHEMVMTAVEHIVADGKISEFDRSLLLSLGDAVAGNHPGYRSPLRKLKKAF